MHNKFLDATLPVPGILQEAYKRVPKRCTPISYGWKGKHIEFADLSTSKPQLTDLANQDQREQSAELIKAGRLPCSTDLSAFQRAYDSVGAPAWRSAKSAEGGTKPDQVRINTKSASQLAKQVVGNLAAAFRSS